MNDQEKMAIERSCERLVREYCAFIDTGRLDDFESLWATDAEWKTTKGDLHGRSAIRNYIEMMNRDEVSIHLTHNVLIDVHDKASASGASTFAYFGGAHSDGKLISPRLMGRYLDKYALTASGWKIQSRRSEILLRAI